MEIIEALIAVNIEYQQIQPGGVAKKQPLFLFIPFLVVHYYLWHVFICDGNWDACNTQIN